MLQCTPEGRAQMMLDFKQLQANMAAVTAIKPLPGADLVESYVKAYYLTEAGVEEWMTANKEYSTSQIKNFLMFAATNISRTARERLLVCIVKAMRFALCCTLGKAQHVYVLTCHCSK
jgi:hypothetical protein